MNEMMRYIFGSLNSHEAVFRSISKTLRKQRNINRNTALLMAIAMTCLTVQEMKIRSMYGRIENPEAELRKTEGD